MARAGHLPARAPEKLLHRATQLGESSTSLGYRARMRSHGADLSPQLLLLHGVTNSARVWDDVVPLLGADFSLIVPTAAGHRGGPAAVGRATISGLVDDVEALLDERGLASVHIAGNSMGGWMAIELARRGRALSVCALSPAGCWTPGEADETHATSTIRRGRLMARMAGPLAPLVLRSSVLRRRFLRDAAERGDRLTPRQAADMVRDLAGCVVAPDLLGTTERVLPMDPLPCPVTVAWSSEDRIFPPEVNAVSARQLLPGARHLCLDGVGHVPMIDDPDLCARVIREVVRSGPDGPEVASTA